MKAGIGVLFFFQIHFLSFAQHCLTDGITFQNQNEINQFPVNYPGCQIIDGFVEIQGDDITSLDSLIQLKFISGHLLIENNPKLVDLHGLDSLRSVYGNLDIQNNSSIHHLSGLELLNYVRGDLKVYDNDSLFSLSGAPNFHLVNGNVFIADNDQLSDIGDLELDSIMGYCSIHNHPELHHLALHSLKFVGRDLIIISNSGLEDMDGMDSLHEIKSSLLIRNNQALKNLNALSALTRLGAIDIINNDLLTSLHGLDNVQPDLLSEVFVAISQTLSDCAVMSICAYLSEGNEATISNNAPGCNSVNEVLEECAVDVHEPLDATGIVIYPNPASDYLDIKGLQLQGNDCMLHDLQGQLIRIWNSEQMPLDVHEIPPGVYILSITLDHAHFHKLITKK